MGEVAEPVKQKGPCDYAESKRESDKSEAGAASTGPTVKGLGGQGKELSLDSESGGEITDSWGYRMDGKRA